MNLQDFFINNGKKIENYFLDLIEKANNNYCINELENFKKIINKNIIENYKTDDNEINLKKRRNKSLNNYIKKKTKL